MNWYTRARRRMSDLGITQAALSQSMGIAQAALSHYLVGRRDPPVSFIVRLSEQLQCSTDYLLLDADPDGSKAGSCGIDRRALADVIKVLALALESRGVPFVPELHSDLIADGYEKRIKMGREPRMHDMVKLGIELSRLAEVTEGQIEPNRGRDSTLEYE